MPFPLIAAGIKAGVTAYKAKKALGKLKILGKAASTLAGFFGSKKKREKEAQKLTDFSDLLGQQYTALEGTVGEVQQEFATQREIVGEGQDIQQQQAVMGYGVGQQQMAGQVAGTGLAGVGAGQEATELAQREFANQQMTRALQAREQRFSLGLRESSRMRDIQAAGFQLDRARAEKGLKKKNYGQSLMDMMEV